MLTVDILYTPGELTIFGLLFRGTDWIRLTLKLPGPSAGMGGSLTVTVA